MPDQSQTSTPSPHSTQSPTVSDTTIVRAEIHPAIGISRLGNSETEFYLAPQVTNPEPKPVGFYRDEKGALKREAAQFRLYGYNAAGEVVGELTSANASITWNVHVANRKADWYQWQIAMDIPEAADVVLPLRNPTVTQRDTLVIDAGPQSISGANAAPVACQGSFTGTPVKIGELQTDDQGRLLFLPGLGVSASPTDSPIFDPNDDNSFINANGWYDDVCDGPVDAAVTINGASIPVEAAWVVSAPPNYAPQVKGVRTLYDLLLDLYVQAKWLPAPVNPSFTTEVYPILQRLSGLQWVNQAFAVQFGHGGAFNFEDEAFIKQLATVPTPGVFDPNAELRRQIFNSYRLSTPLDGNQMPWPWIYGDGMNSNGIGGPQQNASISATQQNILSQWASGAFIGDWGQKSARPATSLEQVPTADQPAMLDRAALEFCLADAFHPGCEMTWPMRHLTMYSKPFRLNRRPEGVPEPDYGPTVDQKVLLSPAGPLNAQGPGDISRWMGLPWQADTAYCRAGYNTKYDPFAPTFWPARVPNHVLNEEQYDIAINSKVPQGQRLAAFANRSNWNAPLNPKAETADQMLNMVRIFGSMGVVEVRPGVTDDPALPATMMVASYGPDVPATLKVAGLGLESAVTTQRPSAAHFATQAEGLAAPTPVRHKHKA